MLCNLCDAVGWKGPKCSECPNYKKYHYVEGVGSAKKSAHCFLLAESPLVSGVSADLTSHIGWSYDVERSIKSILDTYLQHNKRFSNISCRLTYAIRCEKDKPTKKEIDACSELFYEEFDEYAVPDTTIIVLAFGAAAIKACGITQSSYKKVQGKFLETFIRGHRVVVLPTISKRQILQNPGTLEILKKHMYMLLNTVHDSLAGKPIALTTPIDVLTEDHIYPKNLQELGKITDEIITYAPVGRDPDKVPISIDTETNTVFPHREKLKLLSVVVAWAPGKAVSIPVEHDESPFTLEEASPYIKTILACPKPKILHNAKFDLRILRRKGWDLENVAWDTMVGEHLLEEYKKGYYGLKELVREKLPKYRDYEEDIQLVADSKNREARNKQKEKEIETESEVETPEKITPAAKKLHEDQGYENVPLKILNTYGSIDADVTRQIAPIQVNKMRGEQKDLDLKRKGCIYNPYFRKLVKPPYSNKEPLRDLMRYQMIPVIKTLANMESRGIEVDHEYVEKLSHEMDRSLQHLMIDIHSMAPQGMNKEKFNPSSTHQLRERLFATGYVHPETKELICYKGIVEPPLTAGGSYSTNAKFLRSLVTQYQCPFSKVILDYRAIQKARSTFIENIKVLSAEDGRMHTTFHPHGTTTGRLCVSGDTVLDTDKGSFVISKLDLDSGEVRILTHKNRYRRILNVFYKGNEEMYLVHLHNGAHIEVTLNHRYFTPSGVHKLKDLKVGSRVTSYHQKSFETSTIKSVEYIGIKEVWDIEVEEDHSYVAQGFVNHNSSSNENMQNIPPRIGKHNIKKCFIPTNPETEVLLQADAKAAEVRIYAAYSRDKNLIQALNDGMDPHSFFSSMVLNPQTILKGIPHSEKKMVLETVGIDDAHAWNYEDFEQRDYYVGTKENPGPDPEYGRRLSKLRSNIKRVVFGILYGAYKTKIAGIVGISEEQAQAIIDSLFRMFPTIPNYIEQTKEQLRFLGMVETFFGRRRRFPNWSALTPRMRNQAERKAVNFKIQSTSSDIVMRTMIDIEKPLLHEFKAPLLITVHDSIVWEIKKEYVSQMQDFMEDYGVKRIGRRYKWLPVPFKWDLEVGPSYGELLPVSEYLKEQEHKQSLLNEEQKQTEYLEQEIRKELATA